eukprot:gene14552-17200_t
MFRRVFQTSVVVIVQLLNPDFDTLYALVVAIGALSLHALRLPYIRPKDNAVQLVVLMNISLILAVFLQSEGTTDDETMYAIGCMMLVVQIALVAYFMIEVYMDYAIEAAAIVRNAKQTLRRNLGQ